MESPNAISMYVHYYVLSMCVHNYVAGIGTPEEITPMCLEPSIHFPHQSMFSDTYFMVLEFCYDNYDD